MARLPDADVQRLKTEISLVRLVESQGHAVTRQGKDAAIRCPFHEGDDTPSLVISPVSNLFHCFACEAAGSVIDGVMKTRGGFGDRLGDEDARGVVPLCLRDPAKRYGSGG
jgi:DNA primase